MFPNMHGDTSPQVANDEMITEFEKSRNLFLPDLYKKFLKKTNGGIPDRKKYPIVGMDDNPFGSIQCFFGFRKQTEFDLLEYNYDLYVGGFPHGIVPIAANGCGDYVCLDLRNDKSRVSFWDKRHFWGTGEWRENDFYHVANSFEDFLRSLTTQHA
jgi:SMI1 / KNR4 family (SUKH-1)